MLTNIKKRLFLFLCLCIPIRLLIVYIAKYISNDYLPYLGILALIPMLGFIIIYLGNYRKTGIEVFGDKIWWNHLRPIHASLYSLFALFAIKKYSYSWLPLLLDVLIGLFSFLLYHF